MNRQHYRDDIALAIRFRGYNHSGELEDIGVPQCDWSCRIFTEGSPRSVVITQKDGVAQGWEDQDGALVVYLDNHALWPGRLIAEFDFRLSDSRWADGDRKMVRRYDLGVDLTAGSRHVPALLESTLEVPWGIIRESELGGELLEKFNEALDKVLHQEDTSTELPTTPEESTETVTVQTLGSRQGGFCCRGMMPVNAEPGNVYDVRTGCRNYWGWGIIKGSCEPLGEMSLRKLFPDLTFDSSPIVVRGGSAVVGYDETTGIVKWKDGNGAQPSFYVWFKFHRHPYYTVSKDGRLVPAQGQYILPKGDNNWHLPPNMTVYCYWVANKRRYVASYDIGNLEIQVYRKRKKTNTEGHLPPPRKMWTGRFSACGVFRARLIKGKKTRSNWKYYSYAYKKDEGYFTVCNIDTKDRTIISEVENI